MSKLSERLEKVINRFDWNGMSYPDLALAVEEWILEKKPKRKRHSITETSYDEEYIDAYNQAISDYLKAMEGE